MNMRYYVVFIQYNKDAQAENRTAPKAFDTLNGVNSAKQYFHEQMGKDMKNVTLGWSIGYILDNYGNKILDERFISDDFDEENLPVEK